MPPIQSGRVLTSGGRNSALPSSSCLHGVPCSSIFLASTLKQAVRVTYRLPTGYGSAPPGTSLRRALDGRSQVATPHCTHIPSPACFSQAHRRSHGSQCSCSGEEVSLPSGSCLGVREKHPNVTQPALNIRHRHNSHCVPYNHCGRSPRASPSVEGRS